jgi:hypothetical protein
MKSSSEKQNPAQRDLQALLKNPALCYQKLEAVWRLLQMAL